MCSEIRGITLGQRVERRHQEVAGAHRDVGNPEVEERRGRQVEIVADPAKVFIDCRSKGLVDQSIDCEHRRVVGARRLAAALRGSDVRRADWDVERLPGPRRHVGFAFRSAVDSQVLGGESDLIAEEPFVDRPDVADAKIAEVDLARLTVRTHIPAERDERRADDGVR